MSYRYRLCGLNWAPFWFLMLGAGLCIGLLHGFNFFVYGEGFVTFCLVFAWKRGYFFTLKWAQIMASIALMLEFWQSVVLHDWLRFAQTLGLLGFVWAALSWVERNFGSASVDSGQRWYEGRLTAIPKISAHVLIDGQNWPATILKIDPKGAFLLLDAEYDQKLLLARKDWELEVAYLGVTTSLKGKLISWLWREQYGLGLQFLFTDLYHQSQYTQMVQTMKGEGLA